MKHKYQHGVTLIEVLIVMVILSLLVTLVSFSYIGQQRASRDDKRRADIISLAHELDRYYEKNGNYPLSCNHTDPSISSCSYIESNYTYGTAPPRISSSSTLSNIKAVLPGISESFGDPLASAGDLPLNQHLTSQPNFIKRQSYLFFSLDASNASTTAKVAINKSGSTTLTCVAGPNQNDYRGVSRGTRPHPYVLGYYSETDKKWIFVHGPKLDTVNDLRWNNDNKTECAPTIL